jgi:hypothetical protein
MEHTFEPSTVLTTLDSATLQEILLQQGVLEEVDVGCV